MKNIKYSDVPVAFDHCVSTTCPLREECLRAMSWQMKDESRPVVSVVNPAVTREDESCPYLKRAVPVKYAIGFSCLENELTGAQYRRFRDLLMRRVGQYKFYAYRSGRQPMSPEVQEMVLAMLQELGAAPKHPFDKMEDCLPWV